MAEKKMASGQQDEVDTEYRQSSHQLEIIECDLSFIGCKDQFPRQDWDEHMQRNAAKHMTLMASETVRINQQLQEKDQKLQEKDQQLQEKDQQLKEKDQQLQEKDQLLQEKDHQLQEKDQQLQEKDQLLQEKDQQFQEKDHQLQEKDQQLKEKDQQIVRLQEILQTQNDETKRMLEVKDDQIRQLQGLVRTGGGETERALEEKDQQMRQNDETHAAEVTALKKKLQEIDDQFTIGDVPPYDLTVANYNTIRNSAQKMWIGDDFYTHPGGYKFRIDLHTHNMAVYLCPQPGEYDDTLPWPARVSITIELRHKSGAGQHIPVTRRLEWGRERKERMIFSSCFIPHEDLVTKTWYLEHNCLRFRITKIQVRK